MPVSDVREWHAFDPENVKMRLEFGRRRVSSYLVPDQKVDSLQLDILGKSLLDLFVWSLVSDGGRVSGEVWWALDASASVARAQFVSASRPVGEGLSFVVGGTELGMTATGPGNSYTMEPDWLDALWVGLVSRDAELLAVLRDFDPEWMVAAHNEGVSFDDYHLAWVKAWQMLLRGERGTAVTDQVVEVMRLTDPEVATIAPAEVLLQLEWPVVRLMWDMVSGDDGVFSADVRSALEANKEFYSRPIGNRVREAEGFVSWPMLGTVCAAVDSGFVVDVESQYLPAALLYDRKDGAVLD